MRSHLLVALSLAALGLYAVGRQEDGTLVLLIGAALEFWFWVRVARLRRETASFRHRAARR